MNPPARGPSHRLAAVWFADIAGYTRLSSENEQAALALVRALQDAARRVVPQHDGRIVKFIGDAVLAEFSSTHAAVRAAAALRDACAVSPGAGGHGGPELRIGVHVGDVVAAPDGDVYGDGVNVAARIQGEAEPGQVVVSEDVWRQLRQRPEFRFTGLGERELRGMAPLTIYAVQVEPGAAQDVGPLGRPAVGFLYRRRMLVLAGLAFLAVLAAVGLLTRDRTPASPQPVPSAPPRGDGGEAPSSSIVVLPFVDMSPGGDNEYFSDGMTEELINALAKLEGLHVASRTSAFAFKGKDLDVREIGSRLKVATVLEGSVRKEGNRLRITAQLVNVTDGYHLWSETYDRELEDVFEIQEQIARAIVDTLRVELASGSPVVSPASRTENLEAYNLYLKGRYFWKRRGGGDLDAAIRYFNESIAQDPAFAPAYSGLADATNALWVFTPVAPSETSPRAQAAALKALEIDSTLAEAHVSMAQVKKFYFDWQGSEREFRRSLELDPGYAPGHYLYAIYLMQQERFDEALAQALRAKELDPLSPAAYANLGRAFYFKREYDHAIEYYQKALELNSQFRVAYGLRGSTYIRKGEHALAMEDFAKAEELAGYPGGDASGYTGEGLAYVQAVAGRQAEARRRLAELKRLAQTTYVSPGVIAIIHIGLGENEEALDWLERGYETRDGWLHWLKAHPVFEPLRSEPRFRRLQEKVGLR